MKNRFLLRTLLMTMVLFVPFYVSGQKSWQDIKIDLTNGNLLTETEISNQSLNTFGVSIDAEGVATRVQADDAAANIVLTGKYHSKEHGWGNFSSTVAVQGPVKISMGTCNWGGNVTVKNAAGETVATFNTNNGTCYHNDKANNIAFGYYKGTEATTLTISGGNYTPYIAIEAVDPSELVSDIKVTYTLGETIAEGVVPEEITVETGKTFTIAPNRTLYAEGKTLTAWSDGTNSYAPGEEITAGNENMTLTPVFTDNTVTLADRTERVTLDFDFQQQKQELLP